MGLLRVQVSSDGCIEILGDCKCGQWPLIVAGQVDGITTDGCRCSHSFPNSYEATSLAVFQRHYIDPSARLKTKCIGLVAHHDTQIETLRPKDLTFELQALIRIVAESC